MDFNTPRVGWVPMSSASEGYFGSALRRSLGRWRWIPWAKGICPRRSSDLHLAPLSPSASSCGNLQWNLPLPKPLMIFQRTCLNISKGQRVSIPGIRFSPCLTLRTSLGLVQCCEEPLAPQTFRAWTLSPKIANRKNHRLGKLFSGSALISLVNIIFAGFPVQAKYGRDLFGLFLPQRFG